MVAVKLAGFSGMVPRSAPELLPDTAAQSAINTKLNSGDIIPYTEAADAGNTGRTGVTTRTLYGLHDPDTDAIAWLSWEDKVDIATPSAAYPDEQRFYYTGDGDYARVSTYALATAGSAPYPTGYYDLGLPLPTTKVTAAATPFTQKTLTTMSRDTGGVVTATTSVAHGLKTATRVTISGFTSADVGFAEGSPTSTDTQILLNNHGIVVGTTVSVALVGGSSGVYTVTSVLSANLFVIDTGPTTGIASGTGTLDFSNLNAVNAEVTVVDSDTFTYSSIGTVGDFSALSISGVVDLDGVNTLRNYVYTWYTPWGEESIASEPSEDLFCKEGAIVELTDLPYGGPGGSNNIRGIRLYRTVSSTTDTEYFRLQTIWFPNSIATVARTSNVATVVTAAQHMFIVGDRVRVGSVSDATFNDDVEVLAVVDDYTFTYTNTGSNVATTGSGGGIAYHDVSETPDSTAIFYGFTGTFTDDFNSLNLVGTLDSTNYEAPVQGLQGLVSIQNNTLAGFRGKTVHFSEPKQFHAWPTEYAITLEYNVVALCYVSGSLLVLTDGYPYRIDGEQPGNFSITRLDALYPCVSARSLVLMSYGAVWASHEGLAMYAPSTGAVLVSKNVFTQESWNDLLDPSTITAVFYGDAYFASYLDAADNPGSFIFEKEDRSSYIVTTTVNFDSTWYDTRTNRLYYTSDTTGDVFEWDKAGEPYATCIWKSKVITTKDFVNIGAARVIADYTESLQVWSDDESEWDEADYDWNAGFGLTFRLWVDGELVYENEVTDKRVFRLPTSYKSDTFEVGIEGNVRIKAIHFGDTPTSLKEV